MGGDLDVPAPRAAGDDDAPIGLDLPGRGPPGGVEWRLPGDLGRRYAAVSGDHNPIHLYPLTAKAFGFPRQIAHGMWSMARCVAALENRLPDTVRVDVAFKKPILLPGTVPSGVARTGEGPAFSLTARRARTAPGGRGYAAGCSEGHQTPAATGRATTAWSAAPAPARRAPRPVAERRALDRTARPAGVAELRARPGRHPRGRVTAVAGAT